MDYRAVCKDVKRVVSKAAIYIREQHENRKIEHIEAKGRQNFVTEADKRAEKILVEGLSRLLPDAGFIAEEGTSDKKGRIYQWVIDPIDGTTNFIHGVYPFAVSVGLVENDEVVVGVVYEFGLDEYFYAWKGGGTWMNGNRIRVSDEPGVKSSLIATGFPYTNFEYLDEFMKSITWFMKNSNGLRRMGSAATDIAYVACGRYDGFYEYGLNPWDIAAGILLVREAGGKCSDFQGKEECLFSKDFICSNHEIYGEFLETIQHIMIPS